VFLAWWEATGEWAEREKMYERALREGLVGDDRREIKQSTSSEA
jgi:hypothetical protein